ncbi:hypothetical protein HGA64_04900 [Candidatus Falkowbacteria bacterium]|nr:hypothetical protein [Candidatus Falkowbacteria bacterium]
MLKTKKTISILAIITLVSLNGFIRYAEAGSLASVKDRIDTSVPSATATHETSFVTHTPLAEGDYFEVVLADEFGNVALGDINCPTSTTASTTGNKIARCTADAAIATGTIEISIANITNPGVTGSYKVSIASYTSGNTIIENGDTLVAIVDTVSVSSNVSAVLTFEISPLATSTDVNGAITTLEPATTSIAYGTLEASTTYIAGQSLKVTTNANDGFMVTVEQNQNLTSGSGADIDSFVDGTSTAPQDWQAPAGLIDDEYTYGHFGFTSNDDVLSSGDTFGDNQWQGFDNTTPVEVMYNDGPADSLTPGKGEAKVAYRVEISPLQETGDYTNVLTYVVIPTY